MDISEVAIITEEERATVEFLKEASALGIRVTNVLEFQEKRGRHNKTEQAVLYLNRLTGEQPVVVMVLEADTILGIAEMIQGRGLNKAPVWVLASVGLGQLKTFPAWRQVFHGGVVVEPFLPELKQFRKYFVNSLEVKNNESGPLLQKIMRCIFF